MPRERTVLCRASDPRWLELRHGLITGSDVANLLGCGYQTRSQVLNAKLQPFAFYEPTPGTRPMRWGQLLQDANQDAIMRASSVRYRPSDLFLRLEHVRLGATLDGLCAAPRRVKVGGLCGLSTHERAFWEHISFLGGVGLVEMKQTELPYWKPDDAKAKLNAYTAGKAPIHYWWQCQAQMHVTGLVWTALICKLGPCDWRGVVVEYDSFAGEEIEEAVHAFWEEHRCVTESKQS